MTDSRQLSRAEEQRIDDKIRRGIREYFKNGLPSGTYSTYQWDGTKIVGGGAAIGALNGVTAVLDASYVPASDNEFVIWSGVHYDTGAYWDIGDPTNIYVPSDGVYLICLTLYLQDCDDFGHGYIRVNGTKRVGQTNYFDGLTKNAICTLSQIRALSAGDAIRGEYVAGSTPVFVLGSTIGGYSSLSVVRLGDVP